MSDARYDLLSEDLIQIEEASGVHLASLPRVLASLVRGGMRSFPRLQAHHDDPFHAFLVQLASLALRKAGMVAAPDDAEAWSGMLLALADGERSAWCLVEPDVRLPAFLQPPIPDGDVEALANCLEFPDELDLLVTAKNHDVKARRMTRPSPEAWVHALVMLQTMQGFGGATKYGIARMNGGLGSRPFIGIVTGGGPAARFQRDLAVLLDGHDAAARRSGWALEAGHALLWLLPWSGEDQIGMDLCDPHAIEICRRVRMIELEGRLACRETGSACERIGGAKELKGMTGDPWMPLNVRDAKGLTVPGTGFDYRLVQRLFSAEFGQAPAQQIRSTDPDALALHMTAVSRGQGKTDGFHQRLVRLPKRVRDIFVDPDGRRALGERAANRVERTAQMVSRVLRPALCAWHQGGADTLDLKDARPREAIDRFEANVDARFFEELWRDIEEGREDDDRWDAVLCDLAQATLAAAMARASGSGPRRWKAGAAAEGRLHGGMHRHFEKAANERRTRRQ